MHPPIRSQNWGRDGGGGEKGGGQLQGDMEGGGEKGGGQLQGDGGGGEKGGSGQNSSPALEPSPLTPTLVLTSAWGWGGGGDSKGVLDC